MQYLLVKKILYSTTSTFISSFHRCLFSTSLPLAEAISKNPPIKSPFAVEYLVKECGLPMEKAIKAFKYIPHLKSPAKPDSVLQFLRQIGLGNADIRKTVTHEPRILCASLEKTIKPRVMDIREVGFSPSQVIRLASLAPVLFMVKNSSLQRNIEFWTPFFGSLEGILSALSRAPYLLTTNVEKVVKPNISFLEEHCGVSPCQIRKVIGRDPSLVTMNPNKLKDVAQRAEELGLPRGSSLFMYLLRIIFNHKPTNLDAKIKNLSNLGFSKREIDSLIKKHPLLLSNSNERIGSSIDFLANEAGLDLPSIASQPNLITYSLERRLIPRHYVMKTLQTKGLVGNYRFSSIAVHSEEKFACKFVRPYKDIIPEVCEAFDAACAGKISLKAKL